MIERIHLDHVDSTNLEARRRVERRVVTATAWITAREQTAGRGTRGRAWVSPRDAGLYGTYVTVESFRLPLTALFTRAAGVACVEAIEAATGVVTRLKAVNDLCAGGGKIGGILTEAVIEDGVMRALLVGVGINLWPAPRRVGAGALAPIALQELRPHLAPRLDARALETAVVDRLVTWVRRVSEPEGRTRVEGAWGRHAMTAGAVARP